MDDDWLGKARELRAEAWDAVQASPPFVAFKKFDDLVVEMGGASSMPAIDLASSWKGAAQRAVDSAAKRFSDHKKLSQGDAAEVVLRRGAEPVPIGRLIEKVVQLGVVLGGSDPVANFRSMMSKDERFYTLRRNNMYFWWVKDEPLPSGWQPETDTVLPSPTAEYATNEGTADDG